MSTITVTLPTKKAGKVAYFQIKFNVADFDKVVDAVAEVKTIEQLYSSPLWKVI